MQSRLHADSVSWSLLGRACRRWFPTFCYESLRQCIAVCVGSRVLLRLACVLAFHCVIGHVWPVVCHLFPWHAYETDMPVAVLEVGVGDEGVMPWAVSSPWIPCCPMSSVAQRAVGVSDIAFRTSSTGPTSSFVGTGGGAVMIRDGTKIRTVVSWKTACCVARVAETTSCISGLEIAVHSHVLLFTVVASTDTAKVVCHVVCG
jgi:hypothetical protein